MEASDHVSEIKARDLEYEECRAEYDLYLKLIQSEMDDQAELKAEIAEIKKELDGSSYIEEMKTHDMLER